MIETNLVFKYLMQAASGREFHREPLTGKPGWTNFVLTVEESRIVRERAEKSDLPLFNELDVVPTWFGSMSRAGVVMETSKKDQKTGLNLLSIAVMNNGIHHVLNALTEKHWLGFTETK